MNNELDHLVTDNSAITGQEPTTAAVEVTIQITVDELNVIFASLQELPHRVVDPILRKVLQQAQSQLQG